MLNETLSLSLVGTSGASVKLLEETATFGGGIQVVSGSLTIDSTAAVGPLTVPENMCLVGRSEFDPRPGESHDLLKHLDVSACP